MPPAYLSCLCRYYVVVVSIGLYGAINWAVQHIEPSKTMAYSCLQPVMAGATHTGTEAHRQGIAAAVASPPQP